MADVKITALAALTAADPINDVIPIVDVSDGSMAASGTTKRISINNILSSSPTASGALTVTGLVTAGSATISGDLTVRSGNKLILNRADNAVSTQLNDAGSGTGLVVNNLNGDGIRLQLAGTTIYSSTSTAVQTWNISGTTAMTLNSTGLGIGVAPSGVNRFVIFNGATQALTLDTSGNLLVGTVTSPAGAKIGAIAKLSTVSIEGTASIAVSTTAVALSRVSGLGGLFFVQGYADGSGVQAWWLVAANNTTTAVIASGNTTGLVPTFTMVGAQLKMVLVSGTFYATSFNITA